MKTALECLPCYLRQALQVAGISTDDVALQLQTMRKVAELTIAMDMERTPPENSVAVYRAIAEITGCADPYLALKQASNEQAIALLPQCRDIMTTSDNSLATALRFAIGGNIIDYGATYSFDVEQAMVRCLRVEYAVDNSADFLERLETMTEGDRILYLADNSGEIVYDLLVVKELADRGFLVTVAVKSGAIINDALFADAVACGMDQYATILENGTSCPGTPLESCSDELARTFQRADLIISKGQGNFETLSEVDAEIFFLLTVKCSVVGAHLAKISKTAKTELPGNGELVFYHYNGNSDGKTH